VARILQDGHEPRDGDDDRERELDLQQATHQAHVRDGQFEAVSHCPEARRDDERRQRAGSRAVPVEPDQHGDNCP